MSQCRVVSLHVLEGIVMCSYCAAHRAALKLCLRQLSVTPTVSALSLCVVQAPPVTPTVSALSLCVVQALL